MTSISVSARPSKANYKEIVSWVSATSCKFDAGYQKRNKDKMSPKFKVNQSSAAVKNAIIGAFGSEEAKKVKRLNCGHIVEIVQMTHEFDDDEIINGIKQLANDDYVQLGRGLKRRPYKNGIRYDIKFSSRRILKSSFTPDEKFIFEDHVVENHVKVETTEELNSSSESDSEPVSANLRSKTTQ